MSTPRPHEKWCKSMPREFDAVMGRGPYKCDCGAEGVAAPLEPSWNDIDYFVLVIDHGEIAGVARFEVRVGSENVYNTVIESLADAKAESLKKNISAYAAAVSKNLQEELANEKERSRRLTDAKQDETKALLTAESRILELEEEIAALKRKSGTE